MVGVISDYVWPEERKKTGLEYTGIVLLCSYMHHISPSLSASLKDLEH